MLKRNFMNRTSKSPDDSIAETVLDLIMSTPRSSQAASDHPTSAVLQLAKRSRAKAAAVAGTLALPVGPLGWLTILPELVMVWRIQAQMVADIAALHGAPPPTREQMLVCLFRHSAGQAVQDLVARVGDRWVVLEASSAVLKRAAKAVGVRLSQRAAVRGASRWVPLMGALGVGTYVWQDTRKVAETAERLFGGEIIEMPQA
jgi:hypothetical protein